MLVKDIMIKEVITADPSSPIFEVAALMTKHQIHGLPVIDKEQKVVGIITETDFFIKDIPELYLPSYIKFLKQSKFMDGLSGKEKKSIEKLIKARAEDIMTGECVTVFPDSQLSEIIKIFKEQGIFTLPVIDRESGRIAGIVTQADIIKVLNV